MQGIYNPLAKVHGGLGNWQSPSRKRAFIVILSDFFVRSPRWGRMVLETYRKPQTKELPLGACPPVAKAVHQEVAPQCQIPALRSNGHAHKNGLLSKSANRFVRLVTSTCKLNPAILSKVIYLSCTDYPRKAADFSLGVGARGLCRRAGTWALLGGKNGQTPECRPQEFCQAHKGGKCGGYLGLSGFALAFFWLNSCPLRHGSPPWPIKAAPSKQNSAGGPFGSESWS